MRREVIILVYVLNNSSKHRKNYRFSICQRLHTFSATGDVGPLRLILMQSGRYLEINEYIQYFDLIEGVIILGC